MTLREFKHGNTGSGYTLSWGAKIVKNDVRSPNLLKFGTLQNNAYTLGDEAKYYDINDNFIFGGEIQKINDNFGTQNIEVADYSVKASQIKVNEVYVAGDLIETIIADLVSTYTDWTITSNISSGVALTASLVLADEWLSDSFKKILDIVNATLRVDKSKNVTVFYLDSASSGKSLTYGVDVLDGGWEVDNTLKAEKVIVKGAFVDQRTTETLSGTSQTEFTATFIPENIEIAGFTQTTSTVDGDYIVDKPSKLITFDAVQTNPSVSYTYKSQIRVETLGEGKTAVLEKKYIQSRSEARKLGKEYKARFINGGVSSKWVKNSSEIESYEVGQTIAVTDASNNKTGTYTISKLSLVLPKKLIIEIGLSEGDLFDQNKETIERIKQLEQINQNQEFVYKDDFLTENVNIAVTTTITELKAIIDDGAVLWASNTTLASDGDLISNTGIDADYALAYNDDGIPSANIIDYLA